LGAFLLVVAAATFVAVRWDQIPDGAKLALLVALTGVCLVIHRLLRRSLPVTAAALFHLGVLLVPIDVAAIGVRAGWGWPTMLLVQGLSATTVFGLAAYTERSVVLRVATWAAVIALAGGIGGTTSVPAGLILALTAAVVVMTSQREELELCAGGWAVVAGLAVPLAGAERLGWPAAGVLTDLGLAETPPHPLAAITGLVAGAALCVLGQRRRNIEVALVGVVCGLIGVSVAFVSYEPSASLGLLAVAVLCLLAEAAAWTWRHDSFWDRPLEITAGLSEGVAVALTAGMAGVVMLAPFDLGPSPVAGTAAAVLAVTWLAGMMRRYPISEGAAYRYEPWGWAPPVAALAASAAVSLWTGSGEATAVVLTILGSCCLLIRPAVGSMAAPPSSHVLAAGLLGFAPLAAVDVPALAGAVALVGGLVLAETAVRVSRSSGGWIALGRAMLLTLLSLIPPSAGGLVVWGHRDGFVAAVGTIGAAWLIALVLDRADTPAPPLSQTPRTLAVIPLVAALALEPNQTIVVGLVFAALALLDAVRLDDPLLAVGVGCGTTVAVIGLAMGEGWTGPQAGVGLTLTGVVFLGLSGTLPRRWVQPAVLSAAIAGATGLALSLGDPALFSTNLLIVGITVAGLGAAIGHTPMIWAGLGTATLGLWGQLLVAEVGVTEPYVAPVAALLLGAGVHGRRRERELSSWLAYTPPVLLMGGSGLLERLAGGPGWHGLIVGAVGATAVAAGGAWRLAGPLFVGTGLVLAITVHETIGVAAGVPTWAWLATGGTLLLTAGVLMERRGLGPYETGRRLVDLVRERFV
jgi:hypothetical protein